MTGSDNRRTVIDRIGARIRWLLPRVLLLIGSIVLLDVVVGLAFCRNGTFFGRPLPPYGLTFSERQVESLQRLGKTREKSTYCFDAELGWSVRPNSISQNEMDRINSAAIRANREYSLEIPPGTTRIAVFGDSFTFCADVSNDETWPHLLEQNGPELEVLNFGVPAYGNDQAYLRYLRDGVPFHPDIVLIGHYVENISRNLSVYRPSYVHKSSGVSVKPRFILDENDNLVRLPCPATTESELKDLILSKRLLETLYGTDHWVKRAPLAYQDSILFWSSFGRIAYAAYEQWTPFHKYYNDVNSEHFRLTLRILRQFYSSALQNGSSRAMVLILPAHELVIEHLEGKPPFWRTLTEHLEGAGIPVLDLTPYLAEAGRHDRAASLFAGHYSREGNAVVARAIYETLFPDRAAQTTAPSNAGG